MGLLHPVAVEVVAEHQRAELEIGDVLQHGSPGDDAGGDHVIVQSQVVPIGIDDAWVAVGDGIVRCPAVDGILGHVQVVHVEVVLLRRDGFHDAFVHSAVAYRAVDVVLDFDL